MKKLTQEQKSKIVNYLGIFGVILTIVITIVAYKQGLLTSQEKMQQFVQTIGPLGLVVFILIQISQTVIPIIPGAMTCLAGVAIYGPWLGFLYNYIGIVIGCALLFLIVRRFGKSFVLTIIKPETYDKYIGWIDKGNKFTYFFAFMMAFPVSPADLLCCIAALSKMSFKVYMIIIIICKPISIFAYSNVLSYAISFIYHLFFH